MGCGPSAPAGPAATAAGQSFHTKERVPQQSDHEFVFSMVLSHAMICLRSTWIRCGCDKSNLDASIERARRTVHQAWDGQNWVKAHGTLPTFSPGVPVHEQPLRSPGLASHSDSFVQQSRERMARSPAQERKKARQFGYDT